MLFSFLTSVVIAGASAIPLVDQHPLGDGFTDEEPGASGLKHHSKVPSRGLSGKFLHITDLHPDLHYKVGSSVGDACHRGKGSAGDLGSAGTDCDSPISLVNETFRWIEENLKDDIDFVVWTGDSARHDNDERIPRTEEEIVHMNEFLADGLVSLFDGKRDPRAAKSGVGLEIPIVPTIGNNDIMPHNIFKAGPNRWTKRFLDIWSKFIPEEQRHTFATGGWFTTEVIPNKLVVISLNTMYFYDSNSAVDGCLDKSQPGYEHMEWLRVQLKLLRDRGMKAMLIGHVPPARSSSKRNWDETCWQKYTLWLHQYRDVITGSMYGHMNIDHFMFQDSHKIKIAEYEADEAAPSALAQRSLETRSLESRSDYLASLRSQWSKMPSVPDGLSLDVEELVDEDLSETWQDQDDLRATKKKHRRKKKKKFLKKIGGRWAERYSVSLVSPSLVPNYYPTIRVIEYNISGLEESATWADVYGRHVSNLPVSLTNGSTTVDTPEEHIDKKRKNKKKKGKDGKKKKPDFEVPDEPSRSSPPGPAYSPQPLTWLGYTQYFANLTKIYDQNTSQQESTQSPSAVGKPSHDRLTFEVEYDTRQDPVYALKDMTVRSFFELASRIAEGASDVQSKLGERPTDSESVNTDDDGVRRESDDDDDDDHNDDSDDDNDDEEHNELNTSRKRKKKKPSRNEAWIMFLERAFVGWVDGEELADKISK